MATKMQAKVALPPMRQRVVVAEHVGEAASRRRVLESLTGLARSGVLDEVGAFIKVERGALARQARMVPSEVKKAAEFGLRVFASLENVVAGAGMWSAVRDAGADGLGTVEDSQVQALQSLMDLVFEAQAAFDGRARMLVAGLGGCDLTPLRRFWATSGLEAAVNLAAEVRRLVRGIGDDPFRRFGVEPGASAKGPRRLQTGRSRPIAPRETDSRDLAILRVIAAGVGDKRIASMTGEFGYPSSQSHVEKRKGDFVRYGWITAGRNTQLTEAGRLWLSEALADKSQAT